MDIKAWAVRVAELRLWLQLTVETQLSSHEAQGAPLLPNLSFNLRVGDSLIPPFPELPVLLKGMPTTLSPALKGKITGFQGKKHHYAQAKGPSETALRHEEATLYREIIDHFIQNLQQMERALRHKQEVRQLSLLSPEAQALYADTSDALSALQDHLYRLQTLRQKLHHHKPESFPFFWDIAFVEVFHGEREGFDIVIGNPPYVRQERIEKDYKTKLKELMPLLYPYYFKARSFPERSDLYVYFYFLGLKLLNPQGVLCYISSNSWLDVEFGGVLQEFFLRHAPLYLVLDNREKRSFAQASINTVIVLAGAPAARPSAPLPPIRFLQLKVPFNEAKNAELFEQVFQAAADAETPTYRLRVRPVEDLHAEGLQENKARYQAQKWGGIYLRAPSIYFTLLKKAGDKLVPLGQVAEVRFGIKTGANQFFYLQPTGKPASPGCLHVRNGAGWEGEIEEKFLKPVIKSPRECRTITIKPEDLHYKIFMCHEDRSKLKGTAALEYIKWGESQRYHLRPTCKGRQKWWDLGKQQPFDFVSLRFRHERNWTPINETPSLLAGDIMFVGTWLDQPSTSVNNALANSTLTIYITELYGRVNLGEGLLTTYGPEILSFLFISSPLLSRNARTELVRRFEALKKREVFPLLTEIQQSDRRALDEVIFDEIGLTRSEREAVYEAVVELVSARLRKAESVKGGEEERMKLLFSQRYGRILNKDEKLRAYVKVKPELRESIRRLFYRYSERHKVILGYDIGNYVIRYSTIEGTERELCERLGWRKLQRYNFRTGKMEIANDFDDFLEKTLSRYVLDAVEAYFSLLADESKVRFQADINEIFAAHQSPLRLFEGLIWVLQNDFLEEKIASEILQMLRERGFGGPLHELNMAHLQYHQKDYEAAIVHANNAFESTLMCIFPRAKGKKPKELISQLRSSDLIPPYHADFLENFYRLIQWVPTIRNNEGAHGPGAEPRKVTPALAEFALHMTYAVVLFLLKRYAEKYPMPPAEEAPPPPPEEGYEDTDLPF